MQVDDTYLVRGGTSEISLKLSDVLIGTISNGMIYSSIADHLGTPVKQINSSGTVVEAVAYGPFGSVLSQTGTLNTKHGFTGHEEDVDSGLVYAQARYYDAAIARFTSQDPMFLKVGTSDFTKRWNGNWRDEKSNQQNNKQLTEDRLALYEYLSNPQNLNSYSYVTNNPLKYTDPTGEFEVHINFTTNVGLGGGAGNTWSFGFASDGSYGASVGWHAGGFAGGDASIGIGLGYSNEKTWSATEGRNTYVGIGGKVGGGADASVNFTPDGKYNGLDFGVGVGLSTPVYLNGGLGSNTVIVSRSVKQDFQNIKQDVTNAVNSTVNAVKKSRQKIFSKFRRKK